MPTVLVVPKPGITYFRIIFRPRSQSAKSDWTLPEKVLRFLVYLIVTVVGARVTVGLWLGDGADEADWDGDAAGDCEGAADVDALGLADADAGREAEAEAEAEPDAEADSGGVVKTQMSVSGIHVP